MPSNDIERLLEWSDEAPTVPMANETTRALLRQWRAEIAARDAEKKTDDCGNL